MDKITVGLTSEEWDLVLTYLDNNDLSRMDEERLDIYNSIFEQLH